MENQSIAKNLIYHRKLKGFTQQELSARTEVTVRTIQRIEKGDVSPHLQTINLLASALEIEVDDLLQLDNPKEEAIQKKWLLLIHGTPLLGFILPFCNVLFPLFLWIHKREDNSLYDTHGAKVVNFHISVLVLYALSLVALVTVEKWGFLFFILVIPLCVSIVIANIIYAVNKYKCYYPLSIPFLRSKTARTTKTALVIIPLFALFHCTPAKIDTITRLDGTKISKDSLTHKILQLTTNAQVQGLSVTVFNQDTAVYQKTFGYKDHPKKLVLTDSTNIYGASLSKAFFSVLVMKLVEDGVIDLDTPLESYLPKKIHEYEPQTRWHDNYADLKADSLYHKITARMCLAHTTGFANWRFFEEDRKLRVNHEPGTAYVYSGEGFVYLQVVLEKLTGKGLEELAQQIVFRPLQMKNSSYQWQASFEKDFAYGHTATGEIYEKDTDNEPRSGSTLETTASDYTKFLTAVLNEKLLTKTSYNEIFSPQIRIRSLKQFGPDSKLTTSKFDVINLSYGLGWSYIETPYGKGVAKSGHGDGFQHYSILFPESGMGILIMSNSDNAEGIYKDLLAYALADTYTPWEWANYIPYNQK
ncbi:serine hydrolase [uncultured Croceitalea sp.]|uniref:serine hydrolase n=1 Tax=uncultured Croceitalea sp. TaxID=1798908 RepID=UPI003305D8CE